MVKLIKGGFFLEEIFNAIANVGFPTVVSIYLLMRFESQISTLTQTILKLEKTIEKLSLISGQSS